MYMVIMCRISIEDNGMEKLQYYIHCLNLKFVNFTNLKLKVSKEKYSTMLYEHELKLA